MGGFEILSVATNILGSKVDSVSLFLPSTNFTLNLVENKELLDNGAGGWHD